jgi:hypothetical protein
VCKDLAQPNQINSFDQHVSNAFCCIFHVFCVSCNPLHGVKTWCPPPRGAPPSACRLLLLLQAAITADHPRTDCAASEFRSCGSCIRACAHSISGRKVWLTFVWHLQGLQDAVGTLAHGSNPCRTAFKGDTYCLEVIRRVRPNSGVFARSPANVPLSRVRIQSWGAPQPGVRTGRLTQPTQHGRPWSRPLHCKFTLPT